ncbi:MAG: YdbH domain-containing protein [Porticoccaceae bacterium]|nr:YdbH domain-containing protein [Porticoccaceae bacterium]
MVRKLAMGLVILALLLAAVVGLLTWQFSGLVTPRIESYLTSYGVESLSTSEVKWRFNRLRIQDIHARGVIEGTPFVLHLEQVDMGYQWWRLFNGAIDSISIGNTHIDLDLSTSDESSSPGTDLEIPPLLPQAWLGSLPVARLTLEAVSGTLRLSDDRVLGLVGSDWELAERELEATLALRELEAGEAPVADTVLLLLDVASRRDKPLEVSIGITNAGRLVANLALSLAADSSWEGLELALHGDVHHRNLYRTLRNLHSAGHPLVAAGDVLDSLPALTGDTRLRLVLQLPAVVTGEMVDWLLDGALQGTVRHRLAWQGWPDPAVGEMQARLSYGLAGSLRDFKIVLRRPATVEGELPDLNTVLPESEFFAAWRREAPFRLEVSTDQPIVVSAGELALQAADALITVGPEGQHLAVQAQLADVVVADSISGSAKLQLGLHSRGQPLLAAQLDGKVHQADDSWLLSGTIAEDGLALSGQWQGVLTDDGDYRLVLDSHTANLPKALETLGTLTSLDLPVALTAGTGRLHYQLSGVQPENMMERGKERVGASSTSLPESLAVLPPGQRLVLSLSGLTGLVQGVAVNGVALDAVIEENGQWRSVDAIEIKVAQLSAGVAVDDIAAAVRLLPSPSLEQAHWAVDHFEARLFDGAVYLEAPFEVALPLDASTTFNLVLSDWQLGEIFALYADHGLSGNGIMSGKLPVQLGAEGISIDGGELSGQQPGGMIVYDGGEAGDAAAAGNQQLNVALRLLNNFRYDTLAVRTDFAPSGDLLLGLQLAGHNPDEFDGQAVNFNINVEENLFDLLRALRLSDDVIKRLEDRLSR